MTKQQLVDQLQEDIWNIDDKVALLQQEAERLRVIQAEKQEALDILVVGGIPVSEGLKRSVRSEDYD